MKTQNHLRTVHCLAGLAILLLMSGKLQAQLDLEGSVPANWTASAGTLSISPNHYKLGTQSLRWNWNAGSVMTVSSPGIVAADVLDFNKHTCDFWVWNGTAIPGGKLRIEFMNGTTAQYWFDFHLDYTGWRRAVRSYRYDMSKKTSPSSTFTSVRITAPASGSGSFYLDDVTWVGARFDRIRDAQNPDITGYDASTQNADAYAKIPNIVLTTPTAAELAELATIRSRWLTSIKGSSPSASSVTTANTLFNGLNIVEDANGIRGKVPGNLYDLEGLLTLARDYSWNTATANASRDKMLLLSRHLLDQGHAANSNSRPGLWYDYRDLPNALILMASAYDAPTKAKYWEFFRWRNHTGDFWSTDWERNTDDIYCGVMEGLGAVLFLTPSDAEAVRQLKGFKQYVNRFWEFSPGSEDGLKVDGMGFHHRTHFNSYMYAFGTMASALHMLRQTSFQIDQTPYENLRLGFIAQMRMSADATGTGGNTVGYFGNALCGRKPFETNISFPQVSVRQMGELGGQFYGQSADPIVARAYNRRYGVNDYALFTSYGAEAAPDGFHQFNYSPLGIYRRANWVASMRAPQKFFWSSEIFPNSNATPNRYGRYQSYGALEILYHGGRVASGMQINGYDWNQPPGTTTIVLPNAKLVALNDREDVRSQLNFSGALSFHDGQSGLYGANFQESTADANHNPSFVWRKSWFAFDSQIICLGSNIANNDTANPTVTTLFQAALPTTSSAITLDGSSITSFPHDSTVSWTSSHWLLDAYATGYLVQPGGSLRITRSNQTSANQNSTLAATTGNFAKAWINHGNAPSGASYEYAVFPATTASAMATAATAHANATTKPYEVIQRDSIAHVVKWKATNQIGYSIFTTTALPTNTQNAGLLMSVQRPCLIMTQSVSSSEARVSVVDPDLNFTNPSAGYGLEDASRPRTLDFVVNGSWILNNPDAGSSIVSSNGVNTTIRVTTQHGLAVHLHLITPPDLTVTFNANGGTAASPTSKSVTFGSTYGTLATTTRSGYTLKGWYTAASGGTKVETTTAVTSASNHTLYAQWNAVPTITTVSPISGPAAGGTTVTITGTNLTGTSAVTFGGTAATSVTVVSATSVTCVTPAKTAGLVDVVLTAPGGSATKTGAFTFAAANYTVTFNANGGSAASPTSKSVTFGSTYGTLATTTRTGYILKGWYTATSGGTKVETTTSVTTAANHTLYAQWNSSPTVNAGLDQNITMGSQDLWTPADLTTAAWYDASDAASITSVSNAVSQWNDKSGKGNHLSQATATARPTTGSMTIAGKNAIAFDGASDFIFTSTGLGSQISSLFIVMQSDLGLNSASAAQLPISTYGDSVSSGIGLGSSTGALTNEVLSVFDEDEAAIYVDRQAASSSTLPSIDTTAHVYSFALNTDWHIGLDGGANLRNLTSGVRHPLKLVNSFAVGAGARTAPTITGYFDGGIAEILCVSSALSLSDRQKVEGHLAHKWGLVNKLPTDHPYKSAAPTKAGAVATATLNGTISDAEGDPLTSTWSMVSGPAAVTFANASSANTTVTFTQTGIYTLRLTANDDSSSAYCECVITVKTTFGAWASTEESITFTGDANQDGIADGIAWLLGATEPQANANQLVPSSNSVSNGDLTVNFKFLKLAIRDSAVLNLQYSQDLGIADPWTNHTITIPDSSSNVGGVQFTITPITGTDLNQVQATVPASAAGSGGKIFVRLKGEISTP